MLGTCPPEHCKFELPFQSDESKQHHAARSEKEPLLPARHSRQKVQDQRPGSWFKICASGVTQLLAVLIVVFALGVVASRLLAHRPEIQHRGPDLVRDFSHMKKESRSAHPAKKPSVVSELQKQQPRPQEPALVRSGNLQAEIDTRHAPRWHSLHNLASEGLSGQLDVHGLPLFTLVTASGRISSTECTTGKTTQGDTSSLRMSLSCPHGIETAFQIHAPAGSAQGYLRLAVEVWAAEGLNSSSHAGWPKDGFQKITLFDARGPLDVRLTGPADLPGLPLTVGGKFFLGGEHPLAFSRAVSEDALIASTKERLATRVSVEVQHLHTMAKPSAERPWRFGAVVGIISEASQARRDFVNYLHHERPGRRTPMVHYNSWFDFYSWQDESFFGKAANHTDVMDEAACIRRVQQFGQNLVVDHGVKVDSFLFDDGWDDTNTLWEFDHVRFPRGFREVARTASGYGSGIGVWLSPAGGYGSSQEKRVSQGRKRGFETTSHGAFDLMGPKYSAWFLEVIMKMRRDEGVNLFKFDGVSRVAGEMEAMLGMIAKVRTAAVAEPGRQALKDQGATTKATEKDDDEIWINLTTGTWASPFFLLWADSIWRGDGDVGPYPNQERPDGLSQRQKWIRWRAQKVQEHIVTNSEFFPLSQLMIHGVVLAGHGDALYARLGPTAVEREFAQEVWSFVGLGLQLQEMYVSAKHMTAQNWETLAEGLNWARANAHVLLDSHWAFGQVSRREVFCVASWQPEEGRGYVLLQNARAEQQPSHSFTLAGVLQLPSEQMNAEVQVGVVKSVPGAAMTSKRDVVSSVQRLKGCRGSALERCLISAATSTSIVLHHTEVLILEVRLAHQLPAA